jgi:hypothetical protein
MQSDIQRIFERTFAPLNAPHNFESRAHACARVEMLRAKK